MCMCIGENFKKTKVMEGEEGPNYTGLQWTKMVIPIQIQTLQTQVLGVEIV